MSCHRTSVAVALCGAALCVASSARAQRAPGPNDNAKKDWTDIPDIPDRTAVAPPAAPLPGPEPPRTAAATGTAVSTTRTTAAEYNEQVAAEHERRLRPNRPMLITGVAIFGLTYASGVLVAAISDVEQDHRLYIPVVGPWLDLGQRPCTFSSGCTSSDKLGGALLIGSGLAQGAGIVIALASLAVPERTREKAAKQVAATPQVHVLPISFAGGGGLGAIGTF